MAIFKGKSIMTWQEFCRAMDKYYNEMIEDRKKEEKGVKIEKDQVRAGDHGKTD